MIEGKLLGIRSVEEKDLETLMEWRNNPAFRRNFRETRELNLVNQRSWYDKTNKSSSDFMFVFERLNDKRLLGAGGILYINWIIRSGDFSFYIGYDNLYIDDNGYAKDATDLLLNYGFNNLNLNKIWMELYEFDNKKMTFFRDHYNFKVDGCLRDNCYEDGRYWNSFIISLTRKDYLER